MDLVRAPSPSNPESVHPIIQFLGPSIYKKLHEKERKVSLEFVHRWSMVSDPDHSSDGYHHALILEDSSCTISEKRNIHIFGC